MQRLDPLSVYKIRIHADAVETAYLPIKAVQLGRCVIGGLLHQRSNLLVCSVFYDLELVIFGLIRWNWILLDPPAVDILIEVVSGMN